MSFADALTIVVAAYAAIVSTVVAIQQRRRDRPQLQVTGDAFLRLMEARDGLDMFFLVQIRATNLGFRPVELHKAGFLTLDGRDVFVPLSGHSPHRPVKLVQDGETAVFYYDLDEVIAATNGEGDPSHVYVDDGSGRRFTGPLAELPHPEREEAG